MVRNDYLFAGNRVAPLLMTARTTYQFEPASPKDGRHLNGGEAGRSALTQP